MGCLRLTRQQFYIQAHLSALFFSIIGFAIYCTVIPTTVTYRKPDTYWTGLWAEPVAATYLAGAAIWSFLFLCFGRNNNNNNNNGSGSSGRISIRSFYTADNGKTKLVFDALLYLGLIASLVACCLSDGSRWWLPTPDSGEFWDRYNGNVGGGSGSSSSSSGERDVVYLDCRTMSASGPNCGVATLQSLGKRQLAAAFFLGLTSFCLLRIVLLGLKTRKALERERVRPKEVDGVDGEDIEGRLGPSPARERETSMKTVGCVDVAKVEHARLSGSRQYGLFPAHHPPPPPYKSDGFECEGDIKKYAGEKTWQK